jgi:GntR family transcriptional regulator
MDESRPIFIQITEQVENDIIDGTLAEGAQIPSINEFATFLRINPATALRGVNRLVDDGIVEKRRGIGMFVTTGARARLVERRRDEFAAAYIRPLIVEAEKLGLDIDQLAALIRSERIES